MPLALRPRVPLGLLLVGAGVVSVAPVALIQPDIRATSRAVGLVAAESGLNVPANLLNAVLNAPMAQIEGVERLTAAMRESKSWWVYSPVNVLGWDPANPEMIKGLVDALVPFPAASKPSGEHLNWWMAANLPMYAGCTGWPPCPDFPGILERMFRVSSLQLYTTGYTFAEPLTPQYVPVTELEGEWGQYLPDQTFTEPVPWYGQYVKLDPMEGVKSVINYLLSEPGQVTFPSLERVVSAYVNLAKSLWDSWYPFVPQSVLWNPAYSISAYITRPFAPLLCPNCNKYDPFMPVDWEPGDPIPPGGYVPPGYQAPESASATLVAASSVAAPVADTGSVADATSVADRDSADAGPASATKPDADSTDPEVRPTRGTRAKLPGRSSVRAGAAVAPDSAAAVKPTAPASVGDDTAAPAAEEAAGAEAAKPAKSARAANRSSAKTTRTAE